MRKSYRFVVTGRVQGVRRRHGACAAAGAGGAARARVRTHVAALRHRDAGPFRQSSRERALQLGLDGWVRNRPDGAVEGLVTGNDAAAVETFHAWLQGGPPRAQVQALDWLASDEATASGFQVLG